LGRQGEEEALIQEQGVLGRVVGEVEEEIGFEDAVVDERRNSGAGGGVGAKEQGGLLARG
jgi:hypothetical protein